MAEELVVLTPEGEEWAKERYDQSPVARIALSGFGWPKTHVDLAIKSCNRAAKEAGYGTADR